MTERIEFIDCRRETMFTPIPDGYKFKPRGRGRWFRLKRGAFCNGAARWNQHTSQPLRSRAYPSDTMAATSWAALYEQRASLFEQFGRKGHAC
jgi:hypothetical protein